MNNLIYNQGITFQELCDFNDSIEVEETGISFSPVLEKEKVKSDILIRIIHNPTPSSILHKEWDIIFKVKKMSTSRLKRIFKEVRGYDCSKLYDRDLLIMVISEMYSTQQYKESLIKQTYSISVMDKIETTKLSWEDIKVIRNLYKIKSYQIEEVRNEDNEIIDFKKIVSKDSSYSFKELGDLYNISHIFTRNICLGKVYKEKKG